VLLGRQPCRKINELPECCQIRKPRVTSSTLVAASSHLNESYIHSITNLLLCGQRRRQNYRKSDCRARSDSKSFAICAIIRAVSGCDPIGTLLFHQLSSAASETMILNPVGTRPQASGTISLHGYADPWLFRTGGQRCGCCPKGSFEKTSPSGSSTFHLLPS
jgi:hypothetical protein